MMAHYKLALVGFGNVGQSLARLLQRKAEEMSAQYGITCTITAIASGSHGRAIDPAGIDVDRALELMQGGGSLDQLSAGPTPKDNLEFIAGSGADVLFENTPVNYEDGQPAIEHIRAALENGMHAFTANKGPVVHGFEELRQLAKEKGKKFYFESTVMDGAPVFSVFRELPAANVQAISGVLNSTTNLIFTRMESGETFDQALAYAQEIGVAERDPSGDVMGWDAAVKLAALVTVIMGVPMVPQQVERVGISKVVNTLSITIARSAGKRWKQVCTAVREGDTVKARVAPELIGPGHPFYNIDGTTSIVQFESDVLGRLSIMENDPTPDSTAYGLLADFINAVRRE
jgi:homoserine dehydrogenase